MDQFVRLTTFNGEVRFVNLFMLCKVLELEDCDEVHFINGDVKKYKIGSKIKIDKALRKLSHD